MNSNFCQQFGHKQSFSETKALQVTQILGKIQSKSLVNNVMPIIFDKNLFRQKFMQIPKMCNIKDLYLHNFSAQIIVDKIESTKKKFFNTLFYGLFGTQALPKNAGKITHANIAPTGLYKGELEIDEEQNTLQGSYNLIASNLTMQYNNDVIGALIQYYNLLEPNGMFICNFLGGTTLQQLKQAMLQTDIECFNKAFVRTVPTIEIKQMGALMQRAGFDIPFCASETVVVEYSSLQTMLREIKAMALGNYMLGRKWQHSKKYFERLEENYVKEFSYNNHLKATFEIITAFGSKG